ncbi:MAG: methyltransferase FkbM family [Chitinophagaceae bacterium]|jgi:FkbM family methyltransferase|nr:methyltransferase FkbM family [Chitinophagaceae bacterium]
MRTANDWIFDIGMHKGEDTRYYLRKGFKVLAVEANPLLAKENGQRFKPAIDAGRLTIVNAGIADHEGILPFYVNHRLSEWSSFDKATGTRDNTEYHVIDIPCVTTLSLFERYGIPHYLKVDIEGFDHYCLRDIPGSGEKPRYVSCEAVHLEWLDILVDKGYTKFKLLNQANDFKPINLQQERSPLFPRYEIIKNGLKLRLQKFIPFKHLYGSSGPFGEDTAGDWLAPETVRELYRAFYQYDKKYPLSGASWFDFHATF